MIISRLSCLTFVGYMSMHCSLWVSTLNIEHNKILSGKHKGFCHLFGHFRTFVITSVIKQNIFRCQAVMAADIMVPVMAISDNVNMTLVSLDLHHQSSSMTHL